MTMLGILTLGIVVPRRMIWYCSTPRECPGDIGLSTSTSAGEQACRPDERPRAPDERPRVIPSVARDRLALKSD